MLLLFNSLLSHRWNDFYVLPISVCSRMGSCWAGDQAWFSEGLQNWIRRKVRSPNGSGWQIRARMGACGKSGKTRIAERWVFNFFIDIFLSQCLVNKWPTWIFSSFRFLYWRLYDVVYQLQILRPVTQILDIRFWFFGSVRNQIDHLSINYYNQTIKRINSLSSSNEAIPIQNYFRFCSLCDKSKIHFVFFLVSDFHKHD